MNLWDNIQVAFEGLVANKMRAALTMLGVVIGVSAVITMLALASGTQDQMMQRIKSMGTNVLSVFPGRSRSGGVRGSVGSVMSLTLDDVDAVLRECPTVKAVAPEAQMSAQVKYGNQNTNTTILGTTPDYLGIRNYKIAEGRMFTAEEVSTYRRVAVIGPTTATALFGDSSPVGQMIRISGSQFEVVGLTKAKGAAGGFNDPDDQVIVPVTTLVRRLMGSRNIRSLSVQATTMQLMDQASSEVTAVLNKRHPVAPGEDPPFEIRSQAEIMTMAQDMGRLFTLLLGGIASVSLLVGGIGIMNIMLVSVTERTREIGIRKALGARRRDIQGQFLIEAMVLSLSGGVVGVLLGIFGAVIINHIPNMHAAVSLSSIGMSFGFAAFVGIFFGYYPALQASRLHPIDALRYE
ncbi:MAG TPA: ABC transporter permease [Armatimonadota bacterium]|jgi:putative ABC transport system permease protein